jgi:ABC-type multidrug transport system fused ATPase/permease subunit
VRVLPKSEDKKKLTIGLMVVIFVVILIIVGILSFSFGFGNGVQEGQKTSAGQLYTLGNDYEACLENMKNTTRDCTKTINDLNDSYRKCDAERIDLINKTSGCDDKITYYYTNIFIKSIYLSICLGFMITFSLIKYENKMSWKVYIIIIALAIIVYTMILLFA